MMGVLYGFRILCMTLSSTSSQPDNPIVLDDRVCRLSGDWTAQALAVSGEVDRRVALLARARPLETFGNVPKTVPREKVEDLRAEAFSRLRALRADRAALSVVRWTLTGKGAFASQITSGVPSIAFLFCFAGFIGFEATTIYSEEAKDAPITVPKATYISVLSIGIFYTLTAWLMTMGIGVDKLLPTLTEMGDPSGFLFMLGETYVGATFTMIMGILFMTSIFAAVLAFHNAVARYKFVAGREGILPDSLGQTHATHQSPHRGSVIQTIVALAVVTLFLVNGLDPVLNLFVWMSQMGTLGILGLMALTSLSVLMFFMKDAMGESVLATKVLPLITGLVMGYLFIIIFRDFGALTGTEGNLGWMIPALVPLFALIGFALASMLAARDPARFKALGNTKA